MAGITDYMFDTAVVEDMLEYLRASLGIHAVVLDSDGRVVPIAGFTAAATLPVSATFPFDFPENIGGVCCAAPDATAFRRAEPHIRMCIRSINSLLQRELEVKQAGDEILQLSAQLNFLFNLANRLFGINNLKEFCRIILAEISKAIHAEHAFIETKGRWDDRIRLSSTLDNDKIEAILGQPSFRTGADHTIIFTLDDGSSILTAPIREKDGIAGSLAFIRGKGQTPFSSYDKKFVGIIDNIISPSIETLRLYDSLQELYVNTVKALAMAIDAKDQYTHGHSYRVAKYSVAIGRVLGIQEESLNDLEIAAYMHDLGKIGVSEAILGKPDRLTAEEYDAVKKHPEMTNKILQPIRLPEFIVDAAVQHHERLNGMGYPYGLKGESICAYARIIAVADVFDAMTSARPYRDAMPVEKALGIICEGADKEFDRKMVLALLSSLNEGTEDPELDAIYRELKFADVQGLNLFLVNLSDNLALTEEEIKRSVVPDNCKSLIDKSS